jgi:hypothetical protein
MATDYERLFGVRSLNGKVEAFAKDVIRTNVFSSKFMAGRPLMAEDGTCEWDEIQFSRALAPVTGHAAQFPEGTELSKINRRSAVAHIKRSKRINPYKIHYERAPGSLRPDAAVYVENELRDAMGEIAATLEYMAAKSLLGTLTVNSTNIPDSTQAFTLSYSPNTFTAGTTWATNTTKILSVEIPALKQDFEQTSGLSPAQVITGGTVEGYIVQNTEITNFATSQMGERFLVNAGAQRGPMLGGLRIGNLDWTVTEAGYVPSGGSFTRFLSTTDEGIVLPADSELRDVLGWAEGRGMIPAQQYGPASSAAQLIAPAPQTGWYAYAMLEGNGPFIKLCVGYVGLPVVMRPDAVCVLNAVP